MKNWLEGNPQVSLAQIAQGMVYTYYMRAKGTTAALLLYLSLFCYLYFFLFCCVLPDQAHALTVILSRCMGDCHEVEFSDPHSALLALGYH